MNSLKKLSLAASIALLPTIASAFPIAAVGTEGLSVVVSGTSNIIATYQGNSAAYSNDLYLGVAAASNPGDEFIFNNHGNNPGDIFDLGSFGVGTELIFRLHVNNTGYDYYTGAASRNPDNLFHARVQSGWAANTTLVSFEDLYGTPEGINGFNDLSFSFTNTTSAPSSVPEPTTLGLFGLGLAGLGLGLRRRKK